MSKKYFVLIVCIIVAGALFTPFHLLQPLREKRSSQQMK